MKFKIIVVVFLLCTMHYVLCTVSYAQPQIPHDLINIPTAYPIQKGNYCLDFRVYGGGGVLTKIRLGLLDSLFLGLSLSVDGLIGSSIPVIPAENPGVIAKFRIFDEITSKLWPTISLGFDSSHYWDVKGKGFYGVISKEFPIGKMFMHGHTGLNWPIGSNAPMGFFVGSDFFFTPEFAGIGEFELVYGDVPPQLYGSFNFGFQYTPIPSLQVGFSFRNLFAWGTAGKNTREIHIGYTNKLF